MANLSEIDIGGSVLFIIYYKTKFSLQFSFFPSTYLDSDGTRLDYIICPRYSTKNSLNPTYQ